MKKLAVLILLLCAAPAPMRCESKEALSLQLTLTRGERSRDSNSTTTVISIRDENLSYRQTYGGRSRGRTPVSKELKLTNEDRRKLTTIVKARRLLRTEAIERPQEESGISRYFELSLRTIVDGQEGFIQIKGSRNKTALKEEKLYQDAVALIEAVYEIIQRADEELNYEPLIH
jgi:hypothetical protein